MKHSLLKEISVNLMSTAPERKVPEFLQGMSTMPSSLPVYASPSRVDWEVVESPRRLLKSYTFTSPEHRKRFLIEFMEEQDQMHHHARMTIDENEIHVEIYTRDLNTITESDHHLARLADLIFTDTAR